jgi:hypothetical protein
MPARNHIHHRTIFSRTKGNRRGHAIARALAMHLQRVENKKSDKSDASPGVNGAITQVTPPIRLVKAFFSDEVVVIVVGNQVFVSVRLETLGLSGKRTSSAAEQAIEQSPGRFASIKVEK